MDREELWHRLVPLMEQDEDYQQALQQLKTAEADYLTLSETLTPEKREILERYIGACEAMEDPLVYLAFVLGKTSAILDKVNANIP